MIDSFQKLVATPEVANVFSSNISIVRFFNNTEVCCRLVNVIAQLNSTHLAGDLMYSC